MTIYTGSKRSCGVLIKNSDRKCIYFDFRPSEIQIWATFDIFAHLGPKIQEMGHLQHLKWPITVSKPFILGLCGVSGVPIGYSAHN